MDHRPSPLRRVLAANIRKLRHQRDLSQEQFAEISGFHRTYVGSVERAERNVSLSTLEAFADALHVSVIQLLQESAADDH
jgi:transcriptional regulator with XRE-family HTH domain